MTPEIMQSLLESVAGNGVLGAILAWFMWQHTRLFRDSVTQSKELRDVLLKNTAALTRVHDVMDRIEGKPIRTRQ